MKRDDALNRIATFLAQLESYLKLNSGQNLNSPAGLAEDLCVPLLKHVYGHDLVNVNNCRCNSASSAACRQYYRVVVGNQECGPDAVAIWKCVPGC